MTFVYLSKGKIVLRVDDRDHSFKPDNIVGIGNFLAKDIDRLDRITCSSSVDFPKDAGFPKSYDAHKVLDRAVTYAYRKIAIKVEPGPLKDAAETVEKAAKKYGRFPLPLNFLRSGKKGTDALLVFENEGELEVFVGGLRYGANLRRMEKGV